MNPKTKNITFYIHTTRDKILKVEWIFQRKITNNNTTHCNFDIMIINHSCNDVRDNENEKQHYVEQIRASYVEIVAFNAVRIFSLTSGPTKIQHL